MQMTAEQRFRRFLAILSSAIVIATIFVILKGVVFHQALSLSITLRFVIAGVVIATVFFEYKRMQERELAAAPAFDREDRSDAE